MKRRSECKKSKNEFLLFLFFFILAKIYNYSSIIKNIEDIVGEAARERYEITSIDLDKFTKLADNITREICNGGTHQERGKEYIVSITEMLYRGGKLDESIRDGVYNGEYSIPEIVFILLEILLHELYYVDFEEKLENTSSHPLSFIYAWNIYVRLAEDLGKKKQELYHFEKMKCFY